MASQKIFAIITDIVRHSDRHNVVSAYTRQLGRMSFLVSAGKGKTAAARNSMMMPLSVLEADVNLHGNRELHHLRNYSRLRLWKDIYFSPVKNAIALFLSEFLNSYLRESPPDPLMWDFIVEGISTLDSSTKGIANFHIAFLVEFLRYAGISPDISLLDSTPNQCLYFDMREGALGNSLPLHRDVIMGEEARRMGEILRMSLRNFHLFKFNAAERRAILQYLLRYYGIHFPGLTSLKSPAILTELFA